MEYSDFYKFSVSLGIALLLAAVLAPWLFLREPFDLMVESSRLKLLTPIAQDVISLRQATLLRLVPFIPWVSGFLFVAGALTVTTGLRRWYKRQVLRDTGEELSIERKKRKLSNMTAEEVREKATADVLEEEQSAFKVNSQLTSSATNILAVEATLHGRFRDCLAHRIDC
jgi:hypothetical protein